MIIRGRTTNPCNPKDRPFSDDQRVYHLIVMVGSWYTNSILEYLREILEESALCLTDTKYKLDLVLFILEEERLE